MRTLVIYQLFIYIWARLCLIMPLDETCERLCGRCFTQMALERGNYYVSNSDRRDTVCGEIPLVAAITFLRCRKLLTTAIQTGG